jgi:hypothetical protein
VIALLPGECSLLALGRGSHYGVVSTTRCCPERLFLPFRRRTGTLFRRRIGLTPRHRRRHDPSGDSADGDRAEWPRRIPFRKTLHGETWSFGAYLCRSSRLVVAVFGSGRLLATIPFAAMAAGSWDWSWRAAAAIVVVWHRKYSAAFRWMLRSRPLKDREGDLSFRAQWSRRVGLPAVSSEEVEMHGGSFANGVALPSIRRPAVVVTETLISPLDRDETDGDSGA